MMRTILLSAILGVALLGLFSATADADKKPPVEQPQPPAIAGHSSIRIVEDRKWLMVLNAGRDAIKDEAWTDAIAALQAVLDEKNDHYTLVMERDVDGKTHFARWTSIRHGANDLIGSMGAKGLAVYEAAHGDKAKKLLDAARKKKDHRALLAEVALRYRHTKAGSEAHAILEKQFKAEVAAEVVHVKDWPSWRGNVTNTGQATGGPPLLDKKLWSRPILSDVLDGFNIRDNDKDAEIRVKTAIKQVNDLKQPVLPGFFPIASRGVMVYRTQRDVRAVALKEIQIGDEEIGQITIVKPGQLLWKSISMNRSLTMLLEKNATRGKMEQWLNAYEKIPGFNSFLYENTLIGTLTTDGRYVYAINDLAVPPHPAGFAEDRFQPQLDPLRLGDTRHLVMQNELYAYDLINGKLKWDLNSDDPQFKDSHFLGAPISVGGKLYILNEKLIDPKQKIDPVAQTSNPIGGEAELRLVCLDPSKIVQGKFSYKPTIVEPMLVLGAIAQNNRFVQDIGRRVNAVQLAYSDGVLVCPTNAGEVFGIDLVTRSLAWSYPYREKPHQQIVLPGMPKELVGTTLVSKWKSSPPAIQAGKVVFTAPDADSIHCINLKDGKPAWKNAQQKGDLYLAGVFEGRVLIVGNSAIRGLDLKDGSQLWSIATGDLPAGQGVASKSIYYLPLKKGEILAVDVVKGTVKARHRAAKGEASLGNLVFYENLVLTQTPTEVIAYPKLGFK